MNSNTNTNAIANTSSAAPKKSSPQDGEAQAMIEKFHSDIFDEIDLAIENDSTIYESTAFAEIAMNRMHEAGLCPAATFCHYEGTISRTKTNLCGYAFSDDHQRLDVFTLIFAETRSPERVETKAIQSAADMAFNFLKCAAEGEARRRIEPSHPASDLALNIETHFNQLDEIHIHVITDGLSIAKPFNNRCIQGQTLEGGSVSLDKTVKLDIYDIARLMRQTNDGHLHSEISIDFKSAATGSLAAVGLPDTKDEFNCFTAFIPAMILRDAYDRYGPRLLERNVREFIKPKSNGVNAGIAKTLRDEPHCFAAYNNGIVIMADSAQIQNLGNGSVCIDELLGVQIVNGGQTTASIYFAKQRDPSIDLSKVFVCAKIMFCKPGDKEAADHMMGQVSRFANSQNTVKMSDLSAHKPFHREFEKLSRSIYAPDGKGRWFYERATGSYETMLMREGSTPTKKAKLKRDFHLSRKITKTELAKAVMSWNRTPNIVSLGNQKNFSKMTELMDSETPIVPENPTASDFKELIAKLILWKSTNKAASFAKAWRANIACYTMDVLASKIGSTINLARIWANQPNLALHPKETLISAELAKQIEVWAKEVETHLLKGSGRRMVSEWAKSEECKIYMQSQTYSPCSKSIPELRP